MYEKLVLSPTAVVKSTLHTVKHPTQSVCGFLLGKKASGGTLFVSDAVPGFHVHVALSPMPIVALEQISAIAKSRGETVVGVYYCSDSEPSKDTPVPAIIRRLMTMIAEKVDCCVSVTIRAIPESIKSCSFFEASLLQGAGLTNSGKSEILFGQWSDSACTVAPDSSGEGRVVQKVNAAVANLEFKAVVDFDDHLEDPQLDFMNPSLKALM